MEFRITLGEKVAGPELITNGDFSAGFAGWTVGAGWTLVAGKADFVGVGGYSSLDQIGVFTIGRRYRLQYDRTIVQTGAESTVIAMGDYGVGPEPKTIGTHRIDRTIVSATNANLEIEGHLRDQIDNVSVKELTWNKPLTDQPEGINQIKINIELDESIYGLFTRFTSTLEFSGDSYDFIKNIESTEGRCGKIRTLVEAKPDPGGDWEDLFQGVIFISDCDFDIQKQIIKTKIEEETISSIIARGKNEKIFTSNNNIQTFRLPNASTTINPHDVAGARPYGLRASFDLFKLFQRIILVISNAEVDFESDLFSSGTFDEMQLSYGDFIRNNSGAPNVAQDEEFSFSFESLFEACNAVWNIGFVITENVNGSPVIKIERKSTLRTSTSILTLNNVEPTYNYDKKRFYKTTSLGYAKINGSDNNEGIQYVTQDICSTEDLRIVSDILQDSQIIFDLLDGTITDDEFDEDWFFFQSTLVGGVNYNTDIFLPGNLYNGDIDVDDNMTRWIEDLLGNQQLLRGDEGDNTIIKTNPVLDKIYEMEYDLSWREFKKITDFTEQITFNNPQKGIADTDGGIIKIQFSPNGLSTFTLLTQ